MREKKRKRNWRAKKKIENRTKCGIVEKRKHKSMELSADRTEEEKNLWFLWFHQHD